jgi:hypothetical protein
MANNGILKCFATACLATTVLVPSICIAQAPCNFGEEKAKFSQAPQVPIGNTKITVPTDLYVSLIPGSSDNLKIIQLRFGGNVDGLKTALPPYMKAQAGIPGSSCNDRYSDGGYFVNGTGRNEVDSGFDVNYVGWKCVSATVPCPSTRTPFRTCRKDASFKNGIQATANVRLSLAASVSNGDVVIAAQSHTTPSDIAKQLGFLGGILGMLTGGGAFAGVGAIGGAIIGKDMENRVKQMGTFSKSITIPGLPTPDDVGDVTFTLKSASFSGAAPILLNAYYESSHVGGNPDIRGDRINTACFMKAVIVQNGLPNP